MANTTRHPLSACDDTRAGDGAGAACGADCFGGADVRTAGDVIGNDDGRAMQTFEVFAANNFGMTENLGGGPDQRVINEEARQADVQFNSVSAITKCPCERSERVFRRDRRGAAMADDKRGFVAGDQSRRNSGAGQDQFG